jgi:poly(hydroxyalkanoate) depolymerase family esterase
MYWGRCTQALQSKPHWQTVHPDIFYNPTKDRMYETLQTLMRAATRLTKAGRLHEATRTLQRALGGMAGINLAEIAVPHTNAQPTQHSEDFHVDVGPDSFTTASYSHAGLTRRYKLYSPPRPTTQPPEALVVMLHGCTQNPDDFAAGTGMNALASTQGFMVVYPEQAQGANPQRCWNWFKHNHQRRDSGEPALIASLTQKLVQEHGIDSRRVYIAGLSAGGAMAAIVATAYPELYAAAGVHSGLPAGSAKNVAEAMVQMQSGLAAGSVGQQTVPTIVFHGDQDQTVNPRNAAHVLAAALTSTTQPGIVKLGVSPSGRSFTRTVYNDGSGAPQAEHWVIHGGGHAWSGGQAKGSYTDPTGPDATREMLRFFLSQPHGKTH